MDHLSILDLCRDTWKVSCWHRRCSVAKQPRSGKLSRSALGKDGGNRRGCTPLMVSPSVQTLCQLLNCPNGPFHFDCVLELSLVLCISGRRWDGKKSEGPACVQANATKCLLGWVWGTDSGRKRAAAAKSTADRPKRGRHDESQTANGKWNPAKNLKDWGKKVTIRTPQILQRVEQIWTQNWQELCKGFATKTWSYLGFKTWRDFRRNFMNLKMYNRKTLGVWTLLWVIHESISKEQGRMGT